MPPPGATPRAMRSRVVISALLVTALTQGAWAKAPAKAKPEAAPSLKYQAFELPNGLRVLVHEDHATPQVAVVTWFRVGSKDERPGRTGFAHLFEHIMFKGSAHVPDGKLDVLLEGAGGWSNAFTSSDMTVYQNVAQSNFLGMTLWLDADRLAGLTDTLDQAKLDNQRDVVRNERRQSYENAPYGMAELLNLEQLWPKDFGYHWSTIGYHEDLVAASTDDVKQFFDNFYVPNNATMVIAGDVTPKAARALVTKYFGWIPRGPEPARPSYPEPAPITKEIRISDTDQVQVPRVFITFRGPVSFSADEPALDLAADVLAAGKSSRLYERLVYRERLAQDVEAGFSGEELGGNFQVVATCKPGVAPAKLIAAITEELATLGKTPPAADELSRAQNAHEAAFLRGLEPVMSRAIQLAQYAVQAGDANYLGKDLARYRAVTPEAVSAVVSKWLAPTARVVLTISPEPKPVKKPPAKKPVAKPVVKPTPVKGGK